MAFAADPPEIEPLAQKYKAATKALDDEHAEAVGRLAGGGDLNREFAFCAAIIDGGTLSRNGATLEYG